MKLVVDANILVAELLRERGRALIAHLELQLYIAEQAWNEAEHELKKRLAIIKAKGLLAPEEADALFQKALTLAEDRLALVPRNAYAQLEARARQHVPRDLDDWPTVALAMALKANIWTYDRDFLGCGVATWVTETLLAELGGQRG